MKRFSLKQRFRYWFDNRMSKGTGSMIRLLAIITVLFVMLLAFVIVITSAQEEGSYFSALWDSLSYTVNAWMPFIGDGGTLYLILMAIAGIVGLFITSILISILTNGFEEKVSALKQGTSLVLESGHIVILGFNAGAYELIRELCMADPKTPRSIVIAGDTPKEEMETAISENIDIPKKTKIICRSIDIYDPAALACCSIQSCRTVIVNDSVDDNVLLVLLAVNSVLSDSTEKRPTIITCIDKDDNINLAKTAGGGHVLTLPMDSIVSKLIAQTCTQVGIARVFTEVFSFAGNEFYLESCPALTGRTFADAALMMDGATPIGLYKNKKTHLNPPLDMVIDEGDQLFVLAPDKGAFSIKPQANALPAAAAESAPVPSQMNVLIFGNGDSVAKIAAELRSNKRIARLTVVCRPGCEDISYGDDVNVISVDVTDRKALETLLEDVGHVILLSDDTLPVEESDKKTVRMLLRLRTTRDHKKLHFNITAELKQEKTKRLVDNDYADFIVASDISSMMMAQVAETPAHFSVFNELLSFKGNEVFLLPAEDVLQTGAPLTALSIRAALQQRAAIYLGYTQTAPDGNLAITLNPPLDSTVTFAKGDGVIVMAEEM